MTCNYFEYRDMTEKLFYGVALTDEHLNNATEQIRRYIVDGGAAPIMEALGFGIRVVEKQHPLFPELNEVIERRFVYINGKNKGRKLDKHEIMNIGFFLKWGCHYGECGCPAC